MSSSELVGATDATTTQGGDPPAPRSPRASWGPPWSGPNSPFARRLRERLWLPLAVVVALTGWVILREADRLIGAIVHPDGRVASVGDVTGLFACSGRDSWQIWAGSADRPSLPAFIAGYVIGDLLFMAGYFVLLGILLARSRFAFTMLIATAGFDLIEAALLVVTAGAVAASAPWMGWLPTALAWVAVLKWVALGLALLGGLLVRASREALRARLARAIIALWTHRLTVLFVAGFGFVALAPFSGIFDQLPDVQREWFGDGSGFARPAGEATLAFLALLGTAALFWYFGRRRTERVYRRFRTSQGHDWQAAPDSIAWWVGVPVAGLSMAVLATLADDVAGILLLAAAGCLIATVASAWCAQLAWAGGSAQWWLVPAGILAGLSAWAWAAGAAEWLDIRTLGGMFGVSAIVIGLSALLKKLWTTGILGWRVAEPPRPLIAGAGVDRAADTGAGDAAPPLRDPAEDVVATAWLVGDGLAVMVLAIAPLGLVRSLTAPVLMDAADPAVHVGPAVWAGLLIALPMVAGLVVAPVIGIHRLDRMLEKPEADPSLGRILIDPQIAAPASEEAAIFRFDVGIVGVGLTLIGWATFSPASFASLGPVAVTTVLLLAWSMVFGGVMLSMQRSRPLPLFRQLGLSAAPVIAIVTVFMFAVSLWAVPELHGIRTIDDAAVPRDPSGLSTDKRLAEALKDSFDRWLESAPGCGDAPTPLLLVAAEGGGARAAYWTVRAMEELHASDCLGPALFAASGISGGSVGLAIDQVVTAGNAPAIEAESLSPEASAVTALTGPAPLARVVTGFLGGDFIAALTGVRVPTTGNAWLDRAGHLEVAWDEQVPPLAGSYSPEAPAGSPFLVLNSADSVSGCRISVTQLPLAAGPAWQGGERMTADDCGSPTTGAGFALEFDDAWRDCSDNLRWSTVAMLSARFPFVTPGGRMPVDGCSGGAGETAPDAQLVDGGYSDGSGLAPLADLMPELVRLVDDHNRDCASAPAEKECASAPEVRPVVVYLKNERGFEIDAEAERLAAEFLIPLAGLKAKSLQNSEEAWLQRLSDGLGELAATAACAEDDPICRHPVVVVSAATTPTITPPLGWTLSELSRDTLDLALEASLSRCTVVAGYPTLGALRKAFDGVECEE
ncbi:hypothetical protein [Microbacterium hydrocarbonoxydans]|uniref:hypothetical protein n=1 Tax=Microbacterium hydrocarbonoxydans TaxID=273678 RepID=UPI0013DA6B0F|nr:hypothetical protein [Microbacterium hydrocarbonoxydans]